MPAFIRYILSCILPPPPPPPPLLPQPPPTNSLYGFAWVPGNGTPSTLDPAVLAVIPPGTPGLFIGFHHGCLDVLRMEGNSKFEPLKPVFDYENSPFMPDAPAQAVASLIDQLETNPPTMEDWKVSKATKIDLTAYIRYTAWCLNLLNQTGAGHMLLDALQKGQQQVVIIPFNGENNTSAEGTSRNAVAETLYAADRVPTELKREVIQRAIDAKYQGLAERLKRYKKFATDLNAMPLYSLYVDEAKFKRTPRFLHNHCHYMGKDISGQNLMDWLDQSGTPFESWLMSAGQVKDFAVFPRKFLFLAMILQLAPKSAPSAGASSRVKWNVLNEGNNQQGTPGYRPPVIALAHELIHAYYNAAGTACGYDNNNFTTTSAELEVVGLTPFDGNPVSENMVRKLWGFIKNPRPDVTNTPHHYQPGWPLPPRTIYTALPSDETPKKARESCKGPI